MKQQGHKPNKTSFQKGSVPWNKGMTGYKNPPLSTESKEKIRKSHTGMKASPEAKKKMSESHLGKTPWNKGKTLTYMNGNKLAQGMPPNSTSFKKGIIPWNKGIAPELSPNWKGGLTRLQKLEIEAGRKKPEQCELCGRTERICFDHDHKTGKFRGWICHKCNVSLGLIEDNTQTLKMMIEYINKTKI